MSALLSTGRQGGRPTVFGRHGVVSSGHYLASEIGISVLRRGGNAADAAAATGFALALLKPHQNGIAGEAPTLVRWAPDGHVHAVSGHGPAPAAATLEYFRSLGIERIPGDGFLPAVVPSMVDTYLTLLARFGTMRLADVLGPAVELASEGFAMFDSLATSIANCAERFRAEWPSSAEVFLPGGRLSEPGDLFRNPDWADTFKLLLAAEARHRDRLAGLKAAREVFYAGPIAERICQFARTTSVRDDSGQAHVGLLTVEDFANFHATIEEPAKAGYHGWQVFKCGPWSQGPAMLQALNILEGFDLAGMGHNSADYIHVVVEAMKLAYADREFHYGDPAFAPVDMEGLLSKSYAAERGRLIAPDKASLELRPGGRAPIVADSVLDVQRAWAGEGDTTKLEVIDAAGNAVSVTTSGGWLQSSPVIPGLGFPLGTRGQMFCLAEGHPNCVGPGRRPRTTLTPGVAVRVPGSTAKDTLPRPRPGSRLNDGTVLAFGSPGGDFQDQWAIQFFLNLVHFGMSLQQAIEAPTFWTEHWPNSFYPRSARPGSLLMEGRIGPAVRDELARRGHRVTVCEDWSGGNTLAAMHDPATGLVSGAASPRLDPAYAIAF